MLWFLIGSNILNTRLIGFDELVEGYNIINKRPVPHGMWISSHPNEFLINFIEQSLDYLIRPTFEW